MTAPSLVLFDVDGTLITSGGAGARSWRYAFDQLHGIPADIDSHSEAGETDPVVARKTFEGAIGREPTERELAAIFALYLRQLSHEVATSPGYRVLDGAIELLARLSDAGIMLGIVSGAMEGAARVKLGRGDLNRFFLFGGYGTDSSDRTSSPWRPSRAPRCCTTTSSSRLACTWSAIRRGTWRRRRLPALWR